MRALWAAGFLGSAAIAMSAQEPLPVYVWEHPMSVLLVGPMFAALTGLAFKEGMCYGKPEAALLAPGENGDATIPQCLHADLLQYPIANLLDLGAGPGLHP